MHMDRENTQQPSTGGDTQIDFDSKNIKRTDSKKLFTTTKDPWYKTFFSKKNMPLLIGIATAIVLIATVLVLWLTIWSRPDTAPPVDNSPWRQELNDINVETDRIVNSDSGTALTDAIKLYDERIANTTDPNQKFDLMIQRANFVAFHGDPTLGLEGLDQIDESGLADEQRYRLYLAFRFAYDKLDDQASVEKIENKINQLPKSITDVGGQ